jgi:hypothetical protein
MRGHREHRADCRYVTAVPAQSARVVADPHIPNQDRIFDFAATVLSS